MEKIPSSGWSIMALLRFILAFIVVASHLNGFGEVTGGFKVVSDLGGKAAVLGFLLISGISIGYSYFKSDEGFYKRRLLRVYPLYFAAVLFTLFVQFYVGSPFELHGMGLQKAGTFTTVANFLLLQEFITIPLPYNAVLWSLSIEVFFYLLTPLFARMNNLLLSALILVSIVVFAFTYTYWGFTIYGFPAVVYLWPWLTGFLLVKCKKPWPLLLIIPGLAAVYYNSTMIKEPLSAVAFAVTAIIVYLVCTYSVSIKAFKPVFDYLGEISYPLYLFHFPLLVLIYKFGISNFYISLLITFIMVAIFNYVFDHWLKKVFWVPFIDFLDRKYLAVRGLYYKN